MFVLINWGWGGTCMCVFLFCGGFFWLCGCGVLFCFCDFLFVCLFNVLRLTLEDGTVSTKTENMTLKSI